MTDGPWDPFDRLREAIREALAPIGVDFQDWMLMPGSNPGEPKGCQIMFLIRPEAFLSDDEKALEGMLQATQVAESQERSKERVKRAREGLLKITREGILPETDTPEA